MQYTEITITIGDPDAPKPTRWSMVRLSLAALLALVSLVVLSSPPAAPALIGRWFLTLGTTLTLTAVLIGLDVWRARRAGRIWL